MCLFYYFNFERNYDILKSKSPCILFNKNISFNKQGTVSKTENPPHIFRETTLYFSSYKSHKLKVKRSWVGAREKKDGLFLYRLFCPKEFLLTFVFYLNV